MRKDREVVHVIWVNVCMLVEMGCESRERWNHEIRLEKQTE